MAFSNTLTSSKELSQGLVIENGTWSGASVTTGTITAGVATSGEPSFNVRRILEAGFTNDNNNEVKVSYSGLGLNKVNITFTSNDTGTYYLIGEGV